MTPTVFVVDDDASVQRGLARLLKSAGHAVEVFSSAANFLAAPPRDRPGCILVDLRMPGMSGLDLQEALARTGVNLPMVFISGDADVPATARAFKGGALDFLTKPFDENALIEAVRNALERDAERRGRQARRDSVAALFATLTPREREVCVLAARGLPNKEIAFRLGTVEKTVKVHRARAMRKLGATSIAEMVRLVDSAHPPQS
jgi:RNA polymerase sigma factor (sigma-70 family)